MGDRNRREEIKNKANKFQTEKSGVFTFHEETFQTERDKLTGQQRNMMNDPTTGKALREERDEYVAGMNGNMLRRATEEHTIFKRGAPRNYLGEFGEMSNEVEALTRLENKGVKFKDAKKLHDSGVSYAQMDRNLRGPNKSLDGKTGEERSNDNLSQKFQQRVEELEKKGIVDLESGELPEIKLHAKKTEPKEKPSTPATQVPKQQKQKPMPAEMAHPKKDETQQLNPPQNPPPVDLTPKKPSEFLPPHNPGGRAPGVPFT